MAVWPTTSPMALVAMRRSHGDEFEGGGGLEAGKAIGEAGTCATKGVLMAGVNHGGQHVSANLAGPDGGADGVF